LTNPRGEIILKSRFRPLGAAFGAEGFEEGNIESSADFFVGGEVDGGFLLWRVAGREEETNL